MTTSVSTEVSLVEMIDPIMIFEIKLEPIIEDAGKLINVKEKWETQTAARDAVIGRTELLEQLTADLKEGNEHLWVIEDEIRNFERNEDFGKRVVELVQSVCRTNDSCFEIRREINILLGSGLTEKKFYAAY